MNTTFKFGDKVALKRSPNACGIVARKRFVYTDYKELRSYNEKKRS